MATTAPQRLAELFDASIGESETEGFSPNFNVAPTTRVFTVVVEAADESDARVLHRAHWGLLPAWSRDRSKAAGMINARSETLTVKPSFRGLVDSYRCVVPVDGYYEWCTVGVDARTRRPKQPYLVAAGDGAPLALAALWTTWRDPAQGGRVERSCAIITTSANERLAAIHDRMPCILDHDDLEEWLGSPTPPLHLLRPADDERLEAVTVSTAVNNVRNKGPDLVVPTVTTLF